MSNQTSRVPNPYETPLSLAELLGCAAEVLQHLHESNKRLQDHIGSALSESDFGLIEDLQILDSHGQIAFDLANCLKRLSQASANGVLPKKTTLQEVFALDATRSAALHGSQTLRNSTQVDRPDDIWF